MRANAQIAIGVSTLIIAGCGEKRAPSAPTPFRAAVDAIVVTPERNIGVGRETQVRATATLGNGQTLDVTDVAVWQSSDPSIVQLAPRGVAKGVIEGAATITATYQGVSGSRAVKTQMCVSWNIQGPAVIWLGQSVSWRTDAYDGCIPHRTSIAVRWESGTPHIVEIQRPRFPTSSTVTVTGLSSGTAFILAKVEDGGSVKTLEATGTITVLSVRRPPPDVVEFAIQRTAWLWVERSNLERTGLGAPQSNGSKT